MIAVTHEEARCLRELARLFQAGVTRVASAQQFIDTVEVGPRIYDPLMAMMEQLGALSNPAGDGTGFRYNSFQITPKVVELVAELDQKTKHLPENKDIPAQGGIVDELRGMLGKSTWAVVAIVGLFVLAAAANLVSSVIHILQSLGWMARR